MTSFITRNHNSITNLEKKKWKCRIEWFSYYMWSGKMSFKIKLLRKDYTANQKIMTNIMNQKLHITSELTKEMKWVFIKLILNAGW